MADLTQKQIAQAVDAANRKASERQSVGAIIGLAVAIGIPLLLILVFFIMSDVFKIRM